MFIKIKKEYNTDEINPPSSLIIRGYCFNFQFAWVQIDLFENYSSNNFFCNFFKKRILKEIIYECNKNHKNICFYGLSKKQEKFFLKNGFKKNKLGICYEI